MSLFLISSIHVFIDFNIVAARLCFRPVLQCTRVAVTQTRVSIAKGKGDSMEKEGSCVGGSSYVDKEMTTPLGIDYT